MKEPTMPDNPVSRPTADDPVVARRGRADPNTASAPPSQPGANRPMTADCSYWLELTPFDGLEVPHWVDGTFEQ